MVALRERDWRKVFGRAVLHWSDFDGPEQTEQTVEQTRLDPVLARPQTLRSRSRHRQSELSTELARICASVYELPASSDCSDREERTLENRRSALALYTHLLEQ